MLDDGSIAVFGCRTGYLSHAVAALYPDRTVYSLAAEGCADRLGEAGRAVWTGRSDEAANLISVTALEEIPIDDIALIVGEGRDEAPSALFACATTLSATDAANGYIRWTSPLFPLNAESLLLVGPGVDLCRQRTPQRPLSEDETLLLYQATQAATIGEIAGNLARPTDDVLDTAARLVGEGICVEAPVPEGIARFHTFLTTGQIVLPRYRRTLFSILDRQFPAFRGLPFGISAATDETFSYGDALNIIEAISAAMVASGVGRGDRVFVQSAPRIEGSLVFWACARIGAVYAPADRNWPPQLRDRALRKCEASLVFMDCERAQTLCPAWRTKLVVFDSLEGESVPPPDVSTLSDWMACGDGTDCADPQTGPDDLAVLQYTSGSTGEPKCIALSNYAYLASGIIVAGRWNLTKDDTLCCTGEFHTGAGLRNQVLVPPLIGAASIMPGRRDLANVLTVNECCRRYGATILTTTPAYLRRLIDLEDRLDELLPPSVRLVPCTGAPLLRDVIDRLAPRVAAQFIDHFGLTECGPHMLPPLEPNATIAANGGVPAAAVVQVANPDGSLAGTGEVGELRFHSVRLMAGYVGPTAPSDDALRGPWFYTGDLASWNDEGHVKIVGRKREIVKDRQGQVIYMTEVEAALLSDSDVKEAAACGYTTQGGDEFYAAFVEVNEDAGDHEHIVTRLRSLLREQLGAHRSPRHVLVVPDMPRGASDKIRKVELVEKYISE